VKEKQLSMLYNVVVMGKYKNSIKRDVGIVSYTKCNFNERKSNDDTRELHIYNEMLTVTSLEMKASC